MSYDAWKARGPDYDIPQVNCVRCNGPCSNPEDDYGEFVCSECLDNEAEAAWERHCEAFHDGGAVQLKTLEQQQIEARRLK